MADEIKLFIRFETDNGFLKHRINPGSISLDQASARGGGPGVVAATTSPATIDFGSATPGYVYLHNLSTGSTVAIRSTGGVQFAELQPNNIGLIPKGSADWQVYKTTAGGSANVDIRGFST